MSMELIEGERVQVIKPGDRHQGDEGVITGTFRSLVSPDTAEYEVKLDTGRYVYHTPEGITRVDEWEYAVQKKFGRTARTLKEEDWASYGQAKRQFDSVGEEGSDPTWGNWTAKIVKRRKAGPIQDV